LYVFILIKIQPRAYDSFNRKSMGETDDHVHRMQ
jgi:hypothetical protein